MKKILLFYFLIVFILPLSAGDIQLWKNSAPIQAKGNGLSLYNKADEIFLQGNTEINRVDFIIKADRSRIFQRDKAIKSSGNVFAKRIFDSGNYLEAESNKIFYTDTNKILEMFDVKNVNYFLQKDSKIINLKSDFLRVEENKKNRIANVENIKNLTMPFDEIKKDGTKITGIDFIRSEKLKTIGELTSQDFDYLELDKKVFVDRKKSDNNNSTLNCDSLIYDKKTKILNIENMTSFTRIFDEISKDGLKITGNDFVRAEKVKAIGDVISSNFDYIEMTKKFFIDRKKSNNDQLTMKADNLVYDKKNKICKVNDIEEATYFSGKDKEKLKYFLYAKGIIWKMSDDNTDVIEIFGNPLIVRREDDGYIVKANRAFYYKKDGLVVFTDNPILLENDIKGKGVYKAVNIYYYLETKLVKFEKNVSIEFVPRKKKEDKAKIKDDKDDKENKDNKKNKDDDKLKKTKKKGKK
jgi:lipopolysaccharide export system protein LptA